MAMTFQKFILVFPSLHHLWKFVREVSMNYSDFNSSELTLRCDCKETDIKIANEKYKAQFRGVAS